MTKKASNLESNKRQEDVDSHDHQRSELNKGHRNREKNLHDKLEQTDSGISTMDKGL